MSHTVKILTFAWVRTQTKDPEFIYSTQAETPNQLLDELIKTRPNWAELAPRRAEIQCARDQVLVKLNDPISGAREIAFFPPVTGG